VGIAQVKGRFGIQLTNCNDRKYDCVMLPVNRQRFLQLDYDKLENGHDAIIFDIKSFLNGDLINQDYKLA